MTMKSVMIVIGMIDNDDDEHDDNDNYDNDNYDNDDHFEII